MTYTCAAYPHEDATLEEAQAHKHDLVCRKLGLRPGMRLLDVGCRWAGMVRHAVEHYGVTALGVTLSRQQALWGQQMLERAGLTERIGVRAYPACFAFLRDRLRDEGRLLNHCITWADTRHRPMSRTAFVERYVFPDGELAGSGRIVTEIEDAGLEVRHQENLREHYDRTCAEWGANLIEH